MNDYRSNSSAKNIFAGVRFVLYGLDSVSESQYRSEIVSRGGIDVGRYDSSCTHVIVSGHVYDNPVCAAARKDGKFVVTETWVEDCISSGMLEDPNKVFYMPVKDMSGIPGGERFTVCLTGYQRQKRESIMRMVNMMGSRFSKPLIANQVTHLVCYKFEGEKYELAKKVKIKLVNHRWLEDCLKAWEILPTDGYSKSGWELEILEAQAKDSEEEAENDERQARKQRSIPDACLEPSERLPEIFTTVQKPDVHQDTAGLPKFSMDEDPAAKNGASSASRDISLVESSKICSKVVDECSPKDVQSHEQKTEEYLKGGNKLSPCEFRKTGETLPSEVEVGRSPPGVVNGKFSSLSYSRKMCNKFGLSGNGLHVSVEGNMNSSKGDLNMSFTASEANCQGATVQTPANDDVESLRTLLPQKRKALASTGGLKSPKLGDHDSSTSASKDFPGSTTSLPSEHGRSFSKGRSYNPHVGLDGSLRGTTELYSKQNQFAASPKSSLAKPVASPDHGISLNQVYSSSIHEGAARNSMEDQPKSSKLLSYKKRYSRQTLESAESLGEDRTPDAKKLDTLNFKQVQAQEQKQAEAIEVARDASVSFVSDRGLQALAAVDEPKQLVILTSSAKSLAKCFSTLGSNKEMVLRAETAPDFCLNGSQETEVNKSGTADHRTLKKKPEVTTENYEELPGKPQDEGCLTFDIANSRTKMLQSGVDDGTCKENSGTEADAARKKKAVGKRKLKSGTRLTTSDDLEEKTLSSSKKSSNTDMLATKSAEQGKNRVHASKRADDSSESMQVHSIAEQIVTENKSNAAPYPGRRRGCINTAANNKLKVSENRVSLNKNETSVEHDSSMDRDKENKGTKTKLSEIILDNHGDNPAAKSELPSYGKVTDADYRKKLQPSKCNVVRSPDPAWFILSGHRVQRKEYRTLIRHLKGRVCKDSHHWSYQATHFIVPEPVRRTEKFFAAAASGRWILKTDYLTASNAAGKFLAEESFEWHKEGLTEDGAISLEAPRKWRLLRERTGHGAFYGMKIIIYGDCIAPSLDTLKRVVKAGGGAILATAPPYTRFLKSQVDYAVVSPSMPHVDAWVQEFLRNQIPCVVADYLVEYVCKPGYPLERHVLYKTQEWAKKSFANLLSLSEEVVQENPATSQRSAYDNDLTCVVCGSSDRIEAMLVCCASRSIGCGIGTHLDFCDPPLAEVPAGEDWLCTKCSGSRKPKSKTPLGKATKLSSKLNQGCLL